MGQKPPEWLMTCGVAKKNKFTTNTEEWKYEGSFGEAPEFLLCTHSASSKEEPTFVGIYAVTKPGEPLYGVGKCELCGKVLWFEINPEWLN
ncbi:MAG: hypothetical protein PHO01_06795 [Desulfotomaculaceae bacterium]|nr:hypothetical protein [Desulfotomaculaceae bacterium]